MRLVSKGCTLSLPLLQSTACCLCAIQHPRNISYAQLAWLNVAKQNSSSFFSFCLLSMNYFTQDCKWSLIHGLNPWLNLIAANNAKLCILYIPSDIKVTRFKKHLWPLSESQLNRQEWWLLNIVYLWDLCNQEWFLNTLLRKVQTLKLTPLLLWKV